MPRTAQLADGVQREVDMLELYHNINSVCARKYGSSARKRPRGEGALLTLRGDQNEPAYLELNPNGLSRPGP